MASMLQSEIDELLFADRIFENLNLLNEKENAPKFEINEAIQDMDFVPENWTDEFDLFEKYSSKMLKSTILSEITGEVDAYFCSSKTARYGCILTGIGEEINQNVLPSFDIEESPFKRDKNSNLLGASPSLTLKQDNTTKRVVANKNILKGETLIVEKAVVINKIPNCVCINNMNYYCNYCLKSIKAFVVCRTCNIFIYCSNECRSLDENEFHKWECKAVNCHFLLPLDTKRLAFQMMLFGANIKFKSTPQKKKLKQIQYSQLLQLPHNLKDLDKNQLRKLLRTATHLSIYLVNYTYFFEWLKETENLKEKSLYRKYLYTGGLLVLHLAQISGNVILFPQEDYNFLANTKGLKMTIPGICLTTNLLERVCTPNSMIILKKNKSVVKALRDIKAGEEITVSNFRFGENFAFAEKKMLLEKKSISCKCMTCRNIPNFTFELLKCYNCEIPLIQFQSKFRCPKCGNASAFKSLDTAIYLKKLYSELVETSFASSFDMNLYIEQFQKIYTIPSVDYIKIFLQLFRHYLIYDMNFALKLIPSYLSACDEAFFPYCIKRLEYFLKIFNTILLVGMKYGKTNDLYNAGVTILKKIKEVAVFFGYEMYYKQVSSFFELIVHSNDYLKDYKEILKKNPSFDDVDFDNMELNQLQSLAILLYCLDIKK